MSKLPHLRHTFLSYRTPKNNIKSFLGRYYQQFCILGPKLEYPRPTFARVPAVLHAVRQTYASESRRLRAQILKLKERAENVRTPRLGEGFYLSGFQTNLGQF